MLYFRQEKSYVDKIISGIRVRVALLPHAQRLRSILAGCSPEIYLARVGAADFAGVLDPDGEGSVLRKLDAVRYP